MFVLFWFFSYDGKGFYENIDGFIVDVCIRSIFVGGILRLKYLSFLFDAGIFFLKYLC